MTQFTPEVIVNEAGQGRPVLILHGGGGPFSVAPLARHLCTSMHTLLPIHPGWNGTLRPEHYRRIDDLARLYSHFLEERDLHDVVVIGSSLGGWIAAELALRERSGRVGALILIDAVGIDVPHEPIRNFFALDARGVAEYSYADPERFYVDPVTLPTEQLALRQANMATMRVYAGEPYMHNPKLRQQLPQIQVPTLCIWGEADRIVTPGYGRAYAEAIPDAKYVEIRGAGHLPQLENPEATFLAINDFLQGK